ncbi:right-handed parallel beta-helix repeat-containing protein [Parasulfuritortus cantonensis]|uniref:Right-handed parallel beta-helix repeat-containing protein n=1 Tax=Parasulfuritortus cantonensis TaxID=2528202 RepID=A0A4R1BED7_9PROT|nr:right-handed parallel beta-helix repeat-containing protein [Parasulfuritortus cantonensis]
MAGRVLKVSRLDGDGPGSLRAALATSGPRVVVFEVGGIIDLGRHDLEIREPEVTVAGETAPEPGITLIRGGIRITGHDVRLSHLRVRPGDAGQAPGSGWQPDGISTDGAGAYNVVVDHCSVTWAVDENLSVSGPVDAAPEATSHAITYSNNIVAEGLRRASHSKGPHSMGSLVHDNCREVVLVGNLYAHNDTRNPRFKAGTSGVVANNLIYDPGHAAIVLGPPTNASEGPAGARPPARLSIVGNVLRRGPDTRPGLPLVAGRGLAYLDDNRVDRRDGKPHEPARLEPAPLAGKPVWARGLTVLPAGQVTESVLRNAGARPWQRDAVDRRIVESVRAAGGRIIDSQDQVGGYPAAGPSRRPLTVPEGDLGPWLASFVPSGWR